MNEAVEHKYSKQVKDKKARKGKQENGRKDMRKGRNETNAGRNKVNEKGIKLRKVEE